MPMYVIQTHSPLTAQCIEIYLTLHIDVQHLIAFSLVQLIFAGNQMETTSWLTSGFY